MELLEVHQEAVVATDAQDPDSSQTQQTAALITSVMEISDHNISCVRLVLISILVLWDVYEEIAKDFKNKF